MRFALVIIFLSCAAWAQSAPSQGQPPRSDTAQPAPPDSGDLQSLHPADEEQGPKLRPGQSPRATIPAGPNDSSSRANVIDLTPPVGDIQEHPNSDAAQQNVNELHPWDPHRAAKDVEVGDYYFKRANYRGAESRYRDALVYKPDDAVSTFRLGQICEKTGRISEAVYFYKHYLKILPGGPYADNAKKSITKLEAELTPPK